MSPKTVVIEVNSIAARRGWLVLDGWAGRTAQPVDVIADATRNGQRRYLIRAFAPTKLAGRGRYLDVGDVALVPVRAVTFEPPVGS